MKTIDITTDPEWIEIKKEIDAIDRLVEEVCKRSLKVQARITEYNIKLTQRERGVEVKSEHNTAQATDPPFKVRDTRTFKKD